MGVYRAGLTFPNPIGPPAGFDKNGLASALLPASGSEQSRSA
jgi:dihydroorotate dehydrogenase